MTPNRRVLWACLAATLAATAWVGRFPDDDLAVASAPPSARVAMTADATRLAWPPPSAQVLAAWGQPLPAAAATAPPRVRLPDVEPVAAPSAPVAPVPPYAWIGRFEEDGRTRALLAGAARTVMLGEGEVLDGQWRIERVGPGAIELLWLPGGLKQRLGPAS